MATDESQTRCHLAKGRELRKTTEKVDKPLARSGEGNVLMCEWAHRKRIVARSLFDYDFRATFAGDVPVVPLRSAFGSWHWPPGLCVCNSFLAWVCGNVHEKKSSWSLFSFFRALLHAIAFTRVSFTTLI